MVRFADQSENVALDSSKLEVDAGASLIAVDDDDGDEEKAAAAR